MAEENVMFLGEVYSFPTELREYINYYNNFEKISDRLSDLLITIMKKPKVSGEVGEPDQLSDLESKFIEKMKQEAKQVILMLAKHNIFDITESELIDKNKGYCYYKEVYKNCFNQIKQNFIDEIDEFMAGMKSAQQSSYSQIKGTGISMYSNSIIAHMTLAAFETSVIKKQCKMADRQYIVAMESMNKSTTSERERKDVAVMLKTYPEISKAINMFVSELIDVFFTKLQNYSIFDYSKIKRYDIRRSSELLNNISLVDDKKSVLIQAFKSCPYNPDIYQQVLLNDLFDIDTFKTAKHFYQDSLLLGIIEDFCKKNIDNYNKTQDIISVLAYYYGTDEKSVLSSLYSDKLNSIKNSIIHY